MTDESKCPFCGTNVAHSPFGNVWCDQCDYRLETSKFKNRPLEDALRAEHARCQDLYADAETRADAAEAEARDLRIENAHLLESLKYMEHNEAHNDLA